MSENKTITIVLSYTDGKLISKSKTETVTKDKEGESKSVGFKQ